MLVYKALYRKMMDDLKDAGMWLDWAEQIMPEHPEYAKFLMDSAEYRLDKTFTETYERFEKLCDDHPAAICMDEVVHDHMMEWHHALKIKLECLEKKDETKEKKTVHK